MAWICRRCRRAHVDGQPCPRLFDTRTSEERIEDLETEIERLKRDKYSRREIFRKRLRGIRCKV